MFVDFVPSVISGAGDAFTQVAFEKRNLKTYDFERTGRFFFLASAFIAPCLSKWFKVLERIKGNPKIIPLARVAIDQIAFAPVFNAIILVNLRLLERLGFETSWRKMKEDWWTIYTSSLKLESPGVLGYDEVQLYTSSEDGDRVLRTTLSFDTAATSSNRIHIETEIRHQQIVGFGSTFSDAAAITVSSLSSGAKKNAIDAYFSPKGAEYTLGRLPMGGTDFSLREYSYDDVAGDFGLEQFLLADEDIKYKARKSGCSACS
ncbi:hypothetical protein ANCCEY_11035 [Ancylostoma ceylanicum]|uniref:Glucosylceramidase n=1 Tax=Ancylostoma ceylanicum TaxID=53326 RepID=A0A0D6LIW9_9BILA|nr:hypothetical protein ANCCEY_11035 [Ancylostoma ceylanicum]